MSVTSTTSCQRAAGATPKYAEHRRGGGPPGRAGGQVACVIILVVLAPVLLTRPRTTASVASVDVVLTLLMIGYRLAKEVTPDRA